MSVSRLDAMRAAAKSGERVHRVDFAGMIVLAAAGSLASTSHGDTLQAYEADDGFLHLDGRINSADCVYTYSDEAGNTWGELRLAKYVFADDVIAAWQRSTLTDEHPIDLVSPDNYQSLAVGSLGSNVRPSDDRKFTLADIVVCHAPVIAKVRGGKVGLSCGYGLTLIEQPGEFNGVPYRFIQTDYVPNHVSIVFDPRGAGCAFVVDGIRSRTFPSPIPRTGDSTMKKIKIQSTKNVDGKVMVGEAEVEVPDEVAAMIADLQAQLAEMQAKMAEGESAAGESMAGAPIVDAEMDPEDPEAELESMDSRNGKRSNGDAADKAKIKFLETELRRRGNVDAQVDARLRVGRDAARILGSDFTVDGKSTAQIKMAIIKAVSPDFTFDGLDVRRPGVIDAVYRLAVDSHRKHADSSGDLLALAGLSHATKAITNADGTKVDLDQLARESINKSFAG